MFAHLARDLIHSLRASLYGSEGDERMHLGHKDVQMPLSEPILRTCEPPASDKGFDRGIKSMLPYRILLPCWRLGSGVILRVACCAPSILGFPRFRGY
jgi:hypothetical protein